MMDVSFLGVAKRAAICAIGLACLVACTICLANATAPATNLANAVSDRGVVTSCLPKVQQRQIELSFSSLSEFSEREDLVERARLGIAAAAKCFPSDGTAWTAMAALELASHGDTPAFRQFFQRSELVAPSEAADIKRRLVALLSLSDKYPDAFVANLDRYLLSALHADISAFLQPLSESQRAVVIARMRGLTSPQIARWFQGHPDQTAEGR